MTTSVGTITTQGAALVAAASLPGGSDPEITSIQISSDVMACTGFEIEMTDVVLQLDASELTFATPTPGTLRVGVLLDTTVGDFVIGTIGLFADEVLVALAAFPGAGTKLAASPPISSGNIRSLYVDLIYQALGGDTQAPLVFLDTDVLSQIIVFGS